MNHIIDNLNNDELTLLYKELLYYIKGELRFVLQKHISEKLRANFSTAQISHHKSIAIWEAANKDFLRLFLERMKITVIRNETNGFQFADGIVYDQNSGPNTKPESLFFGTTAGCCWVVYAHLTSSKEPVVNEVEKRTLFLDANNEARYIIQTKTHSDYSGKWRYSTEGGYLIIDLQTAMKKKDVHIRFSVIGEDSRPDIMLGVLVQSLAKENSIACHKIIAVNHSGNDGEALPLSIPFEEFKTSHPEFAAYFDLGTNMFSSPHGIITMNQLVRFTRKITNN